MRNIHRSRQTIRWALVLIVLLCAASVMAQTGENIARGCKVIFDKTPNHPKTRDDGDAVQLTDGEYTEGHFWSQKTTVGWAGRSPIIMTIDLGKVQPISGISYNSAAGDAAAYFPIRVEMAVSDDGEIWRYVGDLVQMSAAKGLPALDHYSVYSYGTNDLRTRGRFVKLAAVTQGAYTYVDEIEIYRGPDSLLSIQPKGELVGDMKEFITKTATAHGVRSRIASDLTEAREAVSASRLTDSWKADLQKRLDKVEKGLPGMPKRYRDTYKAIFPLNNLHTKVFAVYAPIMHADGLPDFFAWRKHRYDPVKPNEAPERAPESTSVTIEMMRNEYRADSILLTNASDQPIDAVLRVVGLPGGSRPSWLKLSSIPWTDTTYRLPVAAALPDAKFRKGAYRSYIPAGTTRKIWLAVDSSKLKPGAYKGALVVEGSGKTIDIPFSIKVSFVSMEKPRLSLGMWDYTYGEDYLDITTRNQAAAIKIMRSHFIDSPWAVSSVFPSPSSDAFDSNNKLKSPLSFDKFDAWVERWKGARNYMVVGFPTGYADAEMGSLQFNARVGSLAKAVSDHVRSIGIDPQNVRILLVDEPLSDEQDRIVVALAKAIKGGAPELGIWQDPRWDNPKESKYPEAFTLPDTICPDLYTFCKMSAESRKFFTDLRDSGSILWFYMCIGPVRAFDPDGYYRMMSWNAFKYGAEGIGYWSFADNGGAASSWNIYTAVGKPYVPVFLEKNGVTDGIHWQANREGMEDYEYFSMLADAAGRTSNMALKAEAEALIDEAISSVVPQFVNRRWTDNIDRGAADIYRVKILRLLERMD